MGGSVAVVVTGVPGAGKTTMARRLAPRLSARLVSLDSIKETLYATGGPGDPHDLRLAAEAELEATIAQGGTVVIDIWIQPGRDTNRVTGVLTRSADVVVEVPCLVSPEIAVQRYAHRSRAAPHRPPDPATLRRIERSAQAMRPLGVGRCITVDTSNDVDVDVDAIAAQIEQLVS